MLYLALFILGIMTLVRGKIEISPRRRVIGTRARNVGIALVLMPAVAIGTTFLAATFLQRPDQLNIVLAGVRVFEWALVAIFAVLLPRLATLISPLPERLDFSGIESGPREVDFSFLQASENKEKSVDVPKSNDGASEQSGP